MNSLLTFILMAHGLVKISLLHMHNCLLQILVNNLKGTKATYVHFFLIAPGESRYSHFASF